jgi:predicted MFS family arabinose efflux permease
MLPTQQPAPEPTPSAPSPRAKPRAIVPGTSPSRANDPTPIQTIVFLSTIVLFQVTGEATLRMFLNVYMDEALVLPTSVIGLILGIGQLIAGLGALLTPLFTARLGKALTFVLFSLAISLCMLPLIFVPSWYGAGMGYMGAMMMVQIARPALITIQMESVPNTYRALMSAATTMTASVGMGMIGMLGGHMIPSFGYPSFFLVGAWLTALAAIGFWLYNKLIRGGTPL